MPKFLDTRGNASLAIGICARCSRKFPYSDLREDGNIAGLYVCDDDWDTLDPWRLPPRPDDRISLDHARPDVSLSPGPMNIPVDPLQLSINIQTGYLIATDLRSPQPDLLAVAPSVDVQQQPTPWAPNTYYQLGAEVTPGIATGLGAAATEIWVYLCMTPGLSGPTLPAFPTGVGREVTDFKVVWFCIGLFMP